MPFDLDRRQQQQVLNAVNWGDGLPESVLAMANMPFELDGLALPTQPRPQVCGDSASQMLRLDGLPPPTCPVLAWPLYDPVEMFIKICNTAMALDRQTATEPGQGSLMAHLVDSDRRHRQSHPAAVPAVESTPALLYAHRPVFAGFFHFEVDGTCVNHDLTQADVVRLMRDLAGFMGWDFAGADR